MYDGDIEAIIMNVDSASAGPWKLQSLQIGSKTGQLASAVVRLMNEIGDESSESAEADGPVAAAFNAIEKATGVTLALKKFELHSASIGEDAQGEVVVTVEHNDNSYRGHGVSIDIVEAGSRAYLEVVNRILRRRERGLDSDNESDDVSHATI